MNADEALRRFADTPGLPREAMAWALEHWEAAAPRFIARLRAFAAGVAAGEAVEDQVFYVLHLCGQMRETRAYEPLCRLIADDPDIEVWLGDAIGETLPGILINVFDGDVGPLRVAIERADADEFARGAALAALGLLVRSKRALDDEAMRELLRRLRREGLPREVPGFWFSWAASAAALGYEDLKIEAALLAKEGLLDVADFGLVEFDEFVALARSDPTGLAAFREQKVLPLDDAIEALEAWSFDNDSEADGDRLDEDAAGPTDNSPEAPYVNPLRNVGRNDPCPCGSGKKYKKCCMAA